MRAEEKQKSVRDCSACNEHQQSSESERQAVRRNRPPGIQTINSEANACSVRGQGTSKFMLLATAYTCVCVVLLNIVRVTKRTQMW